MATAFKPLKPVSVYLFTALAAGIAFGNYFKADQNLGAFILCLTGFFAAAAWACRAGLISLRPAVIVQNCSSGLLFYLLIILLFLSGFYSLQFRLYPELPKNHIVRFTGAQKYIITGEIVSFARHYKGKTKVEVACQTLELEGAERNVVGKVILSIYGLGSAPPGYGDQIRFQSKIKPIRNFSNPGGFDYKRFLTFRSVYGTSWVNAKKLTILSSVEKVSLTQLLLRRIESLRNNYYFFVRTLKTPDQSAEILISLVTGKKEVLSAHTRDLFSKAGISHLLAISGLHLSIVSFLFFTFFYRMAAYSKQLLISGSAKKLAGVSALIPLACYAVLTGFSPSTQRALIMISMVMISYVSEDETDLVSSFSIAGILILLLDPAALFSISFQLSFTAVGFIMIGMYVVKRRGFLFTTGFWGKFFSMILVTFFAALGTAPLTAHYFNMVSLAGLISNLLFIPLVGFIVLPLGLSSLVLFEVWPAACNVIVKVCFFMLDWTLVICEKITQIPFTWSRPATPGVIEIIGIYSLLLLCILLAGGHRKAALPFFVAFIAAWPAHFVSGSITSGSNFFSDIKNSPADQVCITVLDVGQGSSSLVQAPGNKNILVDGGGFSGLSSFDTGRYIVAPFLWKKKITRLDYVVMTHPETDHLGGLIFILENFKVGALVKNADVGKSIQYKRLMEMCKIKGVPILDSSLSGEGMAFGHARLYFIDTQWQSSSGNPNNNSIVFKLVYKNFSMLFPGDILRERELRLNSMPDGTLDAKILLSPHHGSASSSSKLFLDKVSPGSVIISCGWQNRYGFPHEHVLARYKKNGARVYRTDFQGAVIVTSDGHGYTIQTNRGG